MTINVAIAFCQWRTSLPFDFYDPLTTGDSSLSSGVEAIIAAQTGNMDKAIESHWQHC